MKRSMIRLACAAFASALITAMACATVVAQSFPSRPVKIVVPFPAGGGTDLLARMLAEPLGQKWGQSVYVENTSGAASGSVGALEVARAAPDGHTLMLCPPGPVVMNQLLFKSIGYDSKEWVPISVLTSVPYVLSLRKGFDTPTLAAFATKAKAEPDKISYASPGVGTTGHLAVKQLENRAGIRLVTVPYRGLAPAIKDFVGGHVDLLFDVLTTSLPLHTSGEIKIIASGGTTRSPALPDVPTIAESGYPGFRAITWYAMVAPPKTPDALADRIAQDVLELVNRPAMRDKIASTLRMDTIATPRGETGKFFADETALWAKVVKDANIEMQ
jgi:tripartite-type tricarboxylate transporter receptor subunit TctC